MKSSLMLGVGAMIFGIAVGSLRGDDNVKFDSQEDAFLHERAQDDVFMWRLSDFAAKHGDTDRVRQLGKAIVEERRTDLRDIGQFGKDRKLMIEQPTDLTPPQRTVYNRITGESGHAFDADYVKVVVRQYSVAIPQYERERDHASHSDIRDFASRNLPMLKDHLREAHDAEKAL